MGRFKMLFKNMILKRYGGKGQFYCHLGLLFILGIIFTLFFPRAPNGPEPALLPTHATAAAPSEHVYIRKKWVVCDAAAFVFCFCAGVLVQGVARLRHSSLKPLYQGQQVHREVAVHWHFVNESLALFLFYFLQLAVMATYVSQDLIKMVPLLTIIFAFGRFVMFEVMCFSLWMDVNTRMSVVFSASMFKWWSVCLSVECKILLY